MGMLTRAMKKMVKDVIRTKFIFGDKEDLPEKQVYTNGEKLCLALATPILAPLFVVGGALLAVGGIAAFCITAPVSYLTCCCCCKSEVALPLNLVPLGTCLVGVVFAVGGVIDFLLSPVTTVYYIVKCCKYGVNTDA